MKRGGTTWPVRRKLSHGCGALGYRQNDRGNGARSPSSSLERCKENHSSTSPSRHVRVPTNQEPSTKPDYASWHKLTYTENRQALLDSDADAVMMEWERPIKKVHARIVANEQPGKRVMNIGFGMGIIDAFLQEYAPSQHIIVEACPDVYQNMLQDVFDAYGEHACDMEDFHVDCVPQLRAKSRGTYSFFNGLAPGNFFFQGIACNGVKLRFEKIGSETGYLTCQTQVPDTKVWEGVRRPYWNNRGTHYLQRITWNQHFKGRK